MINNAGLMLYSRLDWGSLESIQNVFEVNVFGVIRVTRIFLPLIKQSKGRVINYSSIVAYCSLQNLGIYCMSKAAVLRFSQTLRKEMNEFGVTVSTICPGYYAHTELTNIALKGLEKAWNETDESVKSGYGDQYCDKIKKLYVKLQGMSFAQGNPNVVVNDIIDAIMNTSPKSHYYPIDGIIIF
ncbi:unnamed protein product, partial [Oppiella nova]